MAASSASASASPASSRLDGIVGRPDERPVDERDRLPLLHVHPVGRAIGGGARHFDRARGFERLRQRVGVLLRRREGR